MPDELRPVLHSILSLLVQVALLERVDEAMEVCLASCQRRAAYTVEAMDLVLELQPQFGQLRLRQFQLAGDRALGVGLLLVSLDQQELSRVKIKVQRLISDMWLISKNLVI